MMDRTVLVLGGGIGASRRQCVEEKLGEAHKIVLDDWKIEYEFSPSFL